MNKYILILLFNLHFLCSDYSLAQDYALAYLPDNNGAIRHWLLLGPFSNSQKSRMNILEHGED